MILELAQSFLASHPTIATVLSSIGLFRLLLKPAFTIAETIAAKTTTKRDDEIVASLQSSKVMNLIRFCLDWFGSIKIPEKKDQ